MARRVFAAVCLSVAHLSFVLAAHAEMAPGSEIDRQNVCPPLTSGACGVLHETKYHLPRRPMVLSPMELRFSQPDGRSGTAAFVSTISAIDNHLVAMQADREPVLQESPNRGPGVTGGGALCGHLLLWMVVGLGGLAGLSAANEGPVKEVTDRKRAEQALTSERDFTSAVLDTVGALMVVMNKDGRIVSFNRACEQTTGYSFEEVKGRCVWDLLPVEEEMGPVKEVFRNLQEGRTPSRHENYWVAKDGRRRMIAWSNTVVLGSDGAVEYVVGTGIDITERNEAEKRQQESEQLLGLLFEHASDGINVAEFNPLTGKRRLVSCNQRYVELAGYKREELMAAENLNELVEYQVSPEERRTWRGKVIDGVPFHGTGSWKRPDGKENYYEWTAAPMKRDGRLLIFGVDRDITERKKAESERQELEAQLLHAQKMEAIGALAGGVAHDFNNLLTGILGYSNLLMLEPSSDEVTEIARSIEEAARRAAQLTEQLLGFARKGKFQNIPIDMHETIREVAELLSRAIGKGVTVREDLQAAQDRVLGDPGQMHQMILNLAVNARDAMPDGGELTIATERVDLGEPYCQIHPEVSPGPHLVVLVSDTGTGIPTDIRERIFEPFFTTKEHGDGTGMGLAMVYGIVKNHGGTINVESEVGRGTTFHILLPLVEEQQGRQVPVTAGHPIGGKGRVLVVDDEEVVRHMAARHLQQLGYKVMTAADGKEAVNRYREFGPRIDLVILDMAMPRMGGRSCFRALREMDVGVRVLMSTGYNLDGAAQGVLTEGVIGFIQKPYDLQRLSEAVAAALGSDTMTGPGEPAGQSEPPKRAAR